MVTKLLTKRQKVKDVITTWTLGSGELTRFGSKPNLTAYMFSGKNTKEVIKADTGFGERDFDDYAEVLVPSFEVSFRSLKTLPRVRAVRILEELERQRFNQLLSAAIKNKSEILFDHSVMMRRHEPYMLRDKKWHLWYEEIAICLMTKKKENEPRNEMRWPEYLPHHDKDCHIFSSLDNGNAYDGICTCGAGLRFMRQHKNNSKHLLSEDRLILSHKY